MSIPGYELGQILSQSGTSALHQARHTASGQAVCVELFTRLNVDTPGVLHVGRLRAVLEAAALLAHPNIWPVSEVGEVGGRLFLVHPLYQGDFLDRRLQASLPTPRQAALWLSALAKALQHAHEHGIYHREVKPAKVFVREGVPLLRGFDLAHVRFLTQLDPQPEGTVSGTPAYMAPEQARGETPADATGEDVWALGALSYQLLTGQPPFVRGTVIDTLLAVIQEDPRPPQRYIDADLQAVCLRCLRKQPKDRYADAAAVEEDLERYLRGERLPGSPKKGWTGWLRWGRS